MCSCRVCCSWKCCRWVRIGCATCSINDAGVVALAAGCRKLQLLSLHGLRLVSDRWVESLVSCEFAPSNRRKETREGFVFHFLLDRQADSRHRTVSRLYTSRLHHKQAASCHVYHPFQRHRHVCSWCEQLAPYWPLRCKMPKLRCCRSAAEWCTTEQRRHVLTMTHMCWPAHATLTADTHSAEPANLHLITRQSKR